MQQSVSVVIVNYNGGPLLSECVQSVLDSTVPVEVFVSDNASRDASLIELRMRLGNDPRLTIIENPTNLGFAKANNLAFRQTRSGFVLFLNPDCIIKPTTLEQMLTLFFEDPQVGMAGCMIRNPDGTEQPGCRRNIPTPWRTFVQILALENTRFVKGDAIAYLHVGQPVPESAITIEAISGAFMLVRRSALDVVGLMDEGYFMHFEDLDWCLRFKQAGWKVLFEPRVEIVHVGGVCTVSRPISVEFHKHLGMARFFIKFFRDFKSLRLYPIIMPGILGRFLYRAIVNGLANVGLFKRRSPRKLALEMVEQLHLVHPEKINIKPRRVVVTGATSLIGDYLLPILLHQNDEVHAVSRRPPDYGKSAGIFWHHADIASDLPEVIRGADVLIHLAPLASLPLIMRRLADEGPKRVIGFGSTSLFTKANSALESERNLVKGLEDAESQIAILGRQYGIRWTIFRPTLVYHLGRDKNVTTIAAFLKRFGFFPLVNGAVGKRQPVHAEDLAMAASKVIDHREAFDKAYNLSGSETLPYREMVERIGHCLGQRALMVDIPLPLLQVIILLASMIPKYQHLNTEMATRVNLDMCFENEEARNDFDFNPRPFMTPRGS
ncbi:MAG: glycosyltransferase [Gammaproteobacteria bacterium]|nr:glycosyltransferase [Gammaproteobacteria bacterium]